MKPTSFAKPATTPQPLLPQLASLVEPIPSFSLEAIINASVLDLVKEARMLTASMITARVERADG